MVLSLSRVINVEKRRCHCNCRLLGVAALQLSYCYLDCRATQTCKCNVCEIHIYNDYELCEVFLPIYNTNNYMYVIVY